MKETCVIFLDELTDKFSPTPMTVWWRRVWVSSVDCKSALSFLALDHITAESKRKWCFVFHAKDAAAVTQLLASRRRMCGDFVSFCRMPADLAMKAEGLVHCLPAGLMPE